jgi:hypothetical protein
MNARTDLARTVALMESTARVERDIAATLGVMAAPDGGEAAARRLALAQEAVRAAHEAVRHSEHLLRLATRWAEHEDIVTLHRLLSQAGHVLADLARTEQEIADTLTSLASRDGSDLAAQRRQAAEEAAAGAQRARDRAQALHRLAGAAAAQSRPA